MKQVRAWLVISLLCGPAANPSGLSVAVKEYCIGCHNARLAEAGVTFDALDSDKPWTDPDTWERVLRQLRARTMPPTGNPRPDPKTYVSLVSALSADLDRGDPRKTAVVRQRVSDLELAERLANFLWKSTPDQELLDVAKTGRLRNPAVLETQVLRMAADARIAGLIGGFFDEWLGLNQVTTIPADAAAFPEFDPQLRLAMRLETRLFLESQIREDRPAVELWTAKYAYLNDRLASHYGIPNVSGPEFRRVKLDGTERAGLLG